MGYIAITHDYFRTDFWTSDEFSEPQAFLDLLSKAEHTRTTRYSRSKKRFDLSRGQRFTTKKHLCARWHIGRAKLEQWLGRWEREGWIKYQLYDKHGIVLTLLEYDHWIHDFDPDENPTTQKVPRNPQSHAAPSLPMPAETRVSDDKVSKEAKVQKVPKEEKLQRETVTVDENPFHTVDSEERIPILSLIG